MSYQVLARKYRPGNFQALEGQTHVLQALVNALDNNRLHHAYLFTGTRGVGKTTIARIFAKCLNCEGGVTSTPCNECASCMEISHGRSVDLIEIDAASRTGVDDMRELLDNVQYMPSSCRYKVYLIDEVHMLSKSSFNAMLKTLEEPPEHVKFLFATTDPKKLPITVLSRCLQFNLKNMTPERVVNHLRQVLEAEQIEAEEAALWQLGRAADGSMRDALSLTDQAIAFSEGNLSEAAVSAMLGTVDRGEVFGLLQALSTRDGPGLHQQVQDIAAFAPDFMALLNELLAVLHRLAIAQVIPEGIDNSFGDREQLERLAGQVSKEEVQLFYQIGLIGKRDLPLAPDPQIGFEMVLIRMLAFDLNGSGTPKQVSSDPGPDAAVPGQVVKTQPATTATPLSGLLDKLNGEAQSASVRKPPEVAQPKVDQVVNDSPQQATPGKLAGLLASASTQADDTVSADAGSSKEPIDTPRRVVALSEPAEVAETKAVLQAQPDVTEATDPGVQAQPDVTEATDPGVQAQPDVTEATDPGVQEQPVIAGDEAENWPNLLAKLGLNGITLTLASNCYLKHFEGDKILLILDAGHSSLCNETQIARIAEALAKAYDRVIDLSIEIGELPGPTPAMIAEQLKLQMMQEAVLEIESDDNVKSLIAGFGARVVQGTISPISKQGDQGK
ncbi:MAG: DNA polymerase III subunit gamma/tau [Gammaproteobacteria bacterium]|nr:DNA polymerase III subunit gamma/tau [Gammaproteobacteria bacterium]